MVLWGGLRLIASRFALDLVTLVGLLYSCCTPTKQPLNAFALVGSVFVTLATAGPTNRWTLTLPMVPIVVLQFLRRLPGVQTEVAMPNQEQSKGTTNSPLPPSSMIHRSITALSLLCLFFSASLVVLFPAVELPPLEGPYHVGVVDFFLPVDAAYDSNHQTKNVSEATTTTTCPWLDASHQRLSVRVLYPTLDKPDPIPYLRPETAVEFCRQTMKFGAPGPLKDFGWMLHTWRLSMLRVKRHAALLPPTQSQDASSSQQSMQKLPVVFFSHGLGGNAELYSYQTMSLAAQGTVVVSVNHADGSAPVVQHPNGSMVLYDFEPSKLWAAGHQVEYVRLRRARTDRRAQELLAAAQAFLSLNKVDNSDLLGKFDLSFRSRLQSDRVTFMGHSFGGATALTAAKRRPNLVHAVVAHEPAVDWMPDDARGSLFASRLLQGLPQQHNFTGGTGGFLDDTVTEDDSLHAVDMLLLFSEEWRNKTWGFSDILESMHRGGRLGKVGTVAEFGVIPGAHHTEFSDTCMITPVWLSRSTGVSGQRNPLHTASEIKGWTSTFLESVRNKSR